MLTLFNNIAYSFFVLYNILKYKKNVGTFFSFFFDFFCGKFQNIRSIEQQFLFISTTNLSELYQVH